MSLTSGQLSAVSESQAIYKALVERVLIASSLLELRTMRTCFMLNTKYKHAHNDGEIRTVLAVNRGIRRSYRLCIGCLVKCANASETAQSGKSAQHSKKRVVLPSGYQRLRPAQNKGLPNIKTWRSVDQAPAALDIALAPSSMS
ncbi:hypothetical protein WAI453_004034 [Rhynchosporium graminicola]